MPDECLVFLLCFVTLNQLEFLCLAFGVCSDEWIYCRLKNLMLIFEQIFFTVITTEEMIFTPEKLYNFSV